MLYLHPFYKSGIYSKELTSQKWTLLPLAKKYSVFNSSD